MLNELQNKVNAKVRLYLHKYAKKADKFLLYNYSRKDAHIARKRIVSEKDIR
jgi:hypothetical protein